MEGQGGLVPSHGGPRGGRWGPWPLCCYSWDLPSSCWLEPLGAGSRLTAGTWLAGCPRQVLALRGRGALRSGQTLGLLPGQGVAQPVLVCLLLRCSWFRSLAASGRRAGTLGRCFCPQGGGQPSRGRVADGDGMLAHRRGTPSSLPAWGVGEQVRAIVLETQPVGASPPGRGRAGGCGGALPGASFSLGVCAAI